MQTHRLQSITIRFDDDTPGVTTADVSRFADRCMRYRRLQLSTVSPEILLTLFKHGQVWDKLSGSTVDKPLFCQCDCVSEPCSCLWCHRWRRVARLPVVVAHDCDDISAPSVGRHIRSFFLTCRLLLSTTQSQHNNKCSPKLSEQKCLIYYQLTQFSEVTWKHYNTCSSVDFISSLFHSLSFDFNLTSSHQ